MTTLCFTDTETSGLYHDKGHEIWEVGVILRDDRGVETERHWWLPLEMSKADSFALKVGKYHERHPHGYEYEAPVEVSPHSDRMVQAKKDFAEEFAKLTYGASLVGANTQFDAGFLRKLLLENGATPEWDYHLVDVENMVAGRLGIAPPWSSTELSILAGVDPKDYERHTALGDAKWVRDLYDRVLRNHRTVGERVYV